MRTRNALCSSLSLRGPPGDGLPAGEQQPHVCDVLDEEAGEPHLRTYRKYNWQDKNGEKVYLKRAKPSSKLRTSRVPHLTSRQLKIIKRRSQEMEELQRNCLIEQIAELRAAFPDEFSQIYTLVREARMRALDSNSRGWSKRFIWTQDHEDLTDAEILEQVGELVLKWRIRHMDDKEYFSRTGDGIDAAKAVAERIMILSKSLLQLDHEHLEIFLYLMKRLSDDRFNFDNSIWTLLPIYNEVERIMTFVSLCATALMLSTAKLKKTSKRGRPSIPYVPVVGELMSVWEGLTFTNTVYPKGTAAGKHGRKEPTQSSTRFIRLALRMIDTQIKTSEVITLTKRAFSNKKSFWNLSAVQRGRTFSFNLPNSLMI